MLINRRKGGWSLANARCFCQELLAAMGLRTNRVFAWHIRTQQESARRAELMSAACRQPHPSGPHEKVLGKAADLSHSASYLAIASLSALMRFANSRSKQCASAKSSAFSDIIERV